MAASGRYSFTSPIQELKSRLNAFARFCPPAQSGNQKLVLELDPANKCLRLALKGRTASVPAVSTVPLKFSISFRLFCAAVEQVPGELLQGRIGKRKLRILDMEMSWQEIQAEGLFHEEYREAVAIPSDREILITERLYGEEALPECCDWYHLRKVHERKQERTLRAFLLLKDYGICMEDLEYLIEVSLYGLRADYFR